VLRYPFLVLLGFGAVAAAASPLPEYPFIFSAGTGRSAVAPDLVRLSFAIAARDRDVKLATAAVESTFASVTSILAAAAVRTSDVDASAVDKSPRSHWDQTTDRTIPDGFQVTRKIKVTARDLTRYPQLMKSLLDLAATEDFSAEFDRSDRQKLQEELLATAAQDAHARAERVAAQFGRKLGAARAIAQIPFTALGDELGFSYGGPHVPPQLMMEEVVVTGARKSLDQFLAPQTITISESVNVVYELQ